jgi:hypothetical protein
MKSLPGAFMAPFCCIRFVNKGGAGDRSNPDVAYSGCGLRATTLLLRYIVLLTP